MANTFSANILIQAPDPEQAARFYVDQLGFTITATEPMIALEGTNINLFIEQGPLLGPSSRSPYPTLPTRAPASSPRAVRL